MPAIECLSTQILFLNYFILKIHINRQKSNTSSAEKLCHQLPKVKIFEVSSLFFTDRSIVYYAYIKEFRDKKVTVISDSPTMSD